MGFVPLLAFPSGLLGVAGVLHPWTELILPKDTRKLMFSGHVGALMTPRPL